MTMVGVAVDAPTRRIEKHLVAHVVHERFTLSADGASACYSSERNHVLIVRRARTDIS
jgi:hypothetical protein